MSSDQTIERMCARVARLEDEFSACVDAFDAANLFTGPSLYFHDKTLAIRRSHPTAIDTLDDDAFFESLYATLTAWGMHRMGPGNTKLADLDEMKLSFRSQATRIRQVQDLALADVADEQTEHVSEQLWDVIASLRVGVGDTKIVAGSKALHHLLPSLVPPIDREYSVRFFYEHKTFNQGDEQAFVEFFPCFRHIAVSCRDQIERRLGTGMNTSETKVIDNAIVGFVLTYLK